MDDALASLQHLMQETLTEESLSFCTIEVNKSCTYETNFAKDINSMAQRDIQDVANYMKQIDESIAAEEEARIEACKECEEQQALEDEELEDEVIDKKSLGFIDDTDMQDESDAFYSEDEEKDSLEEDVSDCLQQEAAEVEQQGSIEVEVYNEDGFGEHFAQEVNKNIQGVKAVVKKTLPNGDLLVKMSGTKDDLENAFAFYVGKEDYSMLSREDKEDFASRLVFDDGDTLAEADYREAVAHCLDPIGVHASTANLADQDTCALSIIKEEKAKRFAKKALKCLQENDFSALSDEELDKLDKLKDNIEDGKPLGNEDNKVWQIMLKDMGYTQEEWDALPPEKREKIWDFHNQPAISRTGFADAVHVGTDPKTGKKFKYRNQYEIDNPETGAKDVTMFNANYDMEHSPNQHPSAAKRQAQKDAAGIEQAGKEKAARDAMQKARGKDTWDVQDFAQMLVGLDNKQRKDLMNELIDAVDKDHADDPRKAGEETLFIKKLFGKKLTLRDFAKAWGKSAPGVMKFADETIDIWRKTLKDMNINSTSQFRNMPQAKFDQFLKLLKIRMEGRRSGSIVAGR